jgi:hypothetical protein
MKILGIDLRKAWRQRRKGGVYSNAFYTLAIGLISLLLAVGEVVDIIVHNCLAGTWGVVENRQDLVMWTVISAWAVLMLLIVRNVYRRRVFTSSTVTLAAWIGALAIVLHILLRVVSGQSAPASDAVVTGYTILGIIILLLANILYIGLHMQEEQDLTV